MPKRSESAAADRASRSRPSPPACPDASVAAARLVRLARRQKGVDLGAVVALALSFVVLLAPPVQARVAPTGANLGVEGLAGLGRGEMLCARPACLAGYGDADVGRRFEAILAAPDVDAARRLATNDSRLARAVLRRARFIAPASESIAGAEFRLAAYHARVDAAASTGEVADAFRDLTRPTASVDADCDYTTGELIAIVLGFILGIIPGLILLILLC